MYITNYARVGKSVLRSVTGVQRPYKEVSVSNSDETVVSYYNEANRFKIKTLDRLSKLQVKQFVLYHFIDIDRFGIVKNISLLEIAEKLKCTVNTIKNNNERLRELEYIDYTSYNDGIYSVRLRDYTKYHLTKREGGVGYITMTSDVMNQLIDIDDVNLLRLEIRKLIKYDEVNIENHTEETNEGEYSYNDIRLFLPKYKSYKKSIATLLNTKQTIFDTEIKEKKISFNLNWGFSLEYLHDKMVDLGAKIYEKFKDTLNISIMGAMDKTIKYGPKRVLLALNTIKRDYYDRNRPIKNIEGLLVVVILGQNNPYLNNF